MATGDRRAVFLRYDLGRYIVAIRWDGAWLPVVYDPAVKYVVTILPPEQLEQYAGVLRRWEGRWPGR